MPATTNATLHTWMQDSPYQGYAYAYPHKTAYRPLDPPEDLAARWADEDRGSLFFYLHVPFCEMRCGFCNLFTTSNPESGLVARWADAILRQARTMRALLGDGARFGRGAIGGGTPTFLTTRELAGLLGGLHEIFGEALADTPLSVEMSPATVDAEKLALLREFGMRRASVGVQSFVEAETRAAGRPQRGDEVERALAMMGECGAPVRNLDLIYGIPGQTAETWRFSLERAVALGVEEIYLYPLYVRPLTGMERLRREPGDNRSALYRQGRDWLLERGYRQVSMRLFRAASAAAAAGPEPEYVCQEDGMVGLGPGARSYTRELHYSTDYAVGRGSIVRIVEDYAERAEADFALARYGILLGEEEQRRRYVIKSLLRAEGLDRAAYRARFGGDCVAQLPFLSELGEQGMAEFGAEFIRPTAKGLEWSDMIGPWLYSEMMRARMADFAWL